MKGGQKCMPICQFRGSQAPFLSGGSLTHGTSHTLAAAQGRFKVGVDRAPAEKSWGRGTPPLLLGRVVRCCPIPFPFSCALNALDCSALLRRRQPGSSRVPPRLPPKTGCPPERPRSYPKRCFSWAIWVSRRPARRLPPREPRSLFAAPRCPITHFTRPIRLNSHSTCAGGRPLEGHRTS